MGAFRIGRKYAAHSYPEPSRGNGSGASSLARNFASGPAIDTAIAADPGTQILWSNVDVGGPGVVVLITPQVTGIIRISGTISVHNDADTPGLSVQVQVEIGGSPLAVPALEQVTVNGYQAIAFLTETTPQPLGAPVSFDIRVTGSDVGITLIAGSSTMEVQEVSAATG